MSSITQVAQLAGVSITTVSRVLNDSHLVNSETVQKVREAMRELDYRAAPVAERRGRKVESRGRLRYKTVAFLWTGIRPSASSLTGIEMLQGASAALRGHHVNLIVDHVGPDGRLPAAVAAGEVDGLLLHGPEPTPEVTGRLSHLPTVWLLSPGSTKWGDRVRPDHESLGRAALEYLVKRGCKHVACITYARRHGTFSTLRAEGFAQEASESGVACSLLGLNLEPQTNPSARFRAAESLAEDFASLVPAADGLFVANELGGYIHEQLARRGSPRMTDLTMIAGDRDFAPQHLEPPPAMVTVRGLELGRLAVDLLFWRLANPTAPRVTKLVASSIESASEQAR